jgi:hypothetical protein
MSKKLIGISIGGYQAKYGDMRALEIAKEIGADAVDFSLDLPICDYRREGEIYSKSEEEIVAYYRAIGERARELGLIVSQTHGKLSGFHGDKEFDDALMKWGPDDSKFNISIDEFDDKKSVERSPMHQPKQKQAPFISTNI